MSGSFLDDPVIRAVMATQKIAVRRKWLIGPRRKRLRFGRDPVTGAAVLNPEDRDKIKRALLREARMMQVALKIYLLKLKIIQIPLRIRIASLKARHVLRRFVTL